MVSTFKLGEIEVDVFKKNIKNVHLSVYPPAGKVRVSAPARMNLDTIRVFVISKLPWIKRQRKKLQDQIRETPREYLSHESHYLWGRRYLLDVVEREAPPQVLLRHSRIVLQIRPGTSKAKRREIVDAWLREQLEGAAAAVIAKWERKMGVRVKKLFIRQMKTRWGSCNPRRQTIRLNTDIAKKPRECLEYIVVHELAHLLERKHNERFIGILDRHLPRWRVSREELNRLPVRHEDWGD